MARSTAPGWAGNRGAFCRFQLVVEADFAELKQWRDTGHCHGNNGEVETKVYHFRYEYKLVVCPDEQ